MSSTLQLCAILFDLDNTLIATRRADAATCRQTGTAGIALNGSVLRELISVLTEQYGVPQDDAIESTSKFLEGFRDCPDNPEYNLDAWRTHLWKEALGDFADLAPEIYLQWLELRYHYLAIHPDVLTLLSSLREHYLLGLITNGPSRAQWEKVERLQLRNYFDCILVSGDLPWEKPDQKIFQEACQHLSVEPKNCIMVGDKLETDIQGGIEAELGGTVWIPISATKTVNNPKVVPDYTIEDVIQLPNILPGSPCADFGQEIGEGDSILSDVDLDHQHS